MKKWMLACAVRFLAPVELVHVLLSCRKLLLLGFESNSDPSLEDTASYLNSILDSLSRKLLLDFMSIKGIGVSSLEDSPRNLLRGLAGVSINSFQTLKFTPKDQYNTYIVDVAVDSFPTTGGRSSWVGNRSLVPFAVILCDDEGDQALRLGSTKYFEISYSQGQATSINESKLSFGLSTYCQHSDDEEEFFLYKCSGRIVHKQTALVQGSHFRYHTGDVVGCGISYSLGSGAPGQIFFTKNGELMYVGHLPGGGTAIPWHAFTVHDEECITSVNFGDHRPFVFNLSNFEQSRLSQLRAYSFPSSFEEEATKVVASMTTSIRVAVYQSVCRKLLYFLGGETYSDDVGEIGFANVFSKILQHHSQAAYTAAGHESDLDSAPHFFSPSELTLSASRSNMFAFTAGAADRVSLANHLFFSVDSREEMSTAQSSVDRPRVTLVNFAPQDSQALPGGDEKGECLDGEDADWCENSMAVELSSVDSFAVRDMRQCEIASVADKVRLATSIAPSLDQMSTEGEEVSSPRPPLGPTSLGRSTYLEKEGSNDESDGADSENTEDAPSDASVATSLCVEINSLDEDGSYIGYGGACYDEEDFEMQGHDYIRGQPSSLPLRTRSNDSDESYATCYARWKSLCGRNGAPADPSYSTLRHQIGTVDRGSDSSARRGKRKRDDSSISRHSNKRGVLCSSRSPTVDGSIDTSVGYVARTSSPGSLSVDKNGNEDGYDGASECGGRSDMVDAGYMTSDNEAAGRDGHENGYGDEGLMSPPHRLPKTRCDPLEPAVHKVPSSGWSVQAQCHPRKARVANRRRKGES